MIRVTCANCRLHVGDAVNETHAKELMMDHARERHPREIEDDFVRLQLQLAPRGVKA